MFPRRRVESHSEALTKLNEEPNLKSYQGVKFDSIFNNLQFYHTSKGLPPCLAHDLFEGVVAFDLALFLKDLMKRSDPWFTPKDLNAEIMSFCYSVEDRRDKPVPLKPKFEKIGGSASEIWSFLRLLPLLIESKIKDAHDDVWKLILLLREIVLLMCAPVVKDSNLSYLESQILDYLDLRAELFGSVPLRPKHHYMMHYPELTAEFGPLIKVWTQIGKQTQSFEEIVPGSLQCHQYHKNPVL